MKRKWDQLCSSHWLCFIVQNCKQGFLLTKMNELWCCMYCWMGWRSFGSVLSSCTLSLQWPFCTVSPHLVFAVTVLYCRPSPALCSGCSILSPLTWSLQWPYEQCSIILGMYVCALYPVLLLVCSNECKWPLAFFVCILNWKQGKEIDFKLWFPFPLLLLCTPTLQWLQASTSRMEPCTWKQLDGHFWISGTWPCRIMTSVHALLLPDVLICLLGGSSEVSQSQTNYMNSCWSALWFLHV